MIFFNLPTIARNMFSFFACVPIDEAPSGPPYSAAAVGTYWSMDLNAQCWTGYHLNWALGLGLPILLLLCMGLPAGILFITLANRSRLDDPEFSQHYGFLYRLYKPKYCWWELVVVLQTLSLVAVSVHCHSLGPLYQGLIVNATLALMVVLLMAAKPHSHAAAYRVSLHAMGCLAFTSYAALSFLPYGVYRTTQAYGIAMGVILLLVNVAFVLSVVWLLYKVIAWQLIHVAVLGVAQTIRSIVMKHASSPSDDGGPGGAARKGLPCADVCCAPNDVRLPEPKATLA